MSRKKDEPVNPAFAALKSLKIQPREKAKIETPKAEPPKPKEPETAEELFSDAMKGVMPIGNDMVHSGEKDSRAYLKSIREKLVKQDSAAYEELKALVSGKTRFDVTSTGEYIEAHVMPIDFVTMKKLKAGDFTIQAHLDLHGMIREDAKTAVSNFISNAYALGYRHLLLVHGRGLKSPENPVLKEGVVSWLTKGALSHIVLAFCSARSCDGGTGALYVLLKNRPKKSMWKRPL